MQVLTPSRAPKDRYQRDIRSQVWSMNRFLNSAAQLRQTCRNCVLSFQSSHRLWSRVEQPRSAYVTSYPTTLMPRPFVAW